MPVPQEIDRPEEIDQRGSPAIRAAENGPLRVTGAVPLYRRSAIESEHGEPLTWQTTERIDAGESYALCRCGGSANKPLCDGKHARSSRPTTSQPGPTSSAPRS